MSTAGTRPSHRSSQLTGGDNTNDSSAASAMGTNTACAQYNTTITSTAPANITQAFKAPDESSIHSTVVRPQGRRCAQVDSLRTRRVRILTVMHTPVILRILGSAGRAWWDDDALRLGASLAYYTLF